MIRQAVDENFFVGQALLPVQIETSKCARLTIAPDFSPVAHLKRLVVPSVTVAALFVFLAVPSLAVSNETDTFKVQPPPVELKAQRFYTKYVDADGYPILASDNVSDYALKEAAFLATQMLAHRPDIKRAMVASGSRMLIMAHTEFTTDLPEFARFKTDENFANDFPAFAGFDSGDYWDARARGTGGSKEDPYCTVAEENLLAYPGDPYAAECILIHEFAHNIHLRGMVNLDSSFDERLKNTYDAAMAKGLWKGKYASVNHHEYFAEGVQSWFGNNRPPDHDHNHVDTRVELKEYDPELAKICEEVFGKTVVKYTKPTTRLTGHLEGYDPSTAPTFAWPVRLDNVRKAIRLHALSRSQAKK